MRLVIIERVSKVDPNKTYKDFYAIAYGVAVCIKPTFEKDKDGKFNRVEYARLCGMAEAHVFKSLKEAMDYER